MAETIRFSRSLYDPAAVDAAVDAYRALGTFEVKRIDESGDIEVTISEPDADVADVLLDEFANHVLGETIKRSRG